MDKIKALKKMISTSNIDNKDLFFNIINQIENSYPKYGLVWEDKSILNDIDINKFKLTESKEKSIIKDSSSKNLLIEGDNILSLQLLLSEYRNKCSLIYIDPPYFTGNNNFRYKDNFNCKDDSYKHSNWLSFMYDRLTLGRKLLSDSGCIFISIDENEYAQLKLLCDEIFGEKNFVSSIVWQNKYTVSNDKIGITTQTESILVYAKNIKTLKPFKNDPLREEYVKSTYKNPNNDPRGPWRTVPLYKKKNPNSYTVISPTGKRWTKPWNYNEEGFKNLIENDLVYWGKNGNSCPQKKVFLSSSRGVSQKNLWLGSEVGYSSDGGDLLEEILGDRNSFSYPKPLNLIKKIIDICTEDKEGIILDFFAGSGTTGQAVLELNKEDGGNRRFILCTNNEINEKLEREYLKNKGYLNDTTYSKFKKTSTYRSVLDSIEFQSLGICQKVTYERLKRVINGYSKSATEYIEGIPSNLYYYKVENIESIGNKK